MILLEKFDKGCYEKLNFWIDSEESLMQFAGPAFTFPLTKEQLDQSLADPNRFSFKVVDTISKEMIGHAEIYLTEQSAWLGRILIGDAALRGKGIGQEIVSRLLDIVFGTMGRTTVQLNVFDWNIAAIKCYERSGFTINPDRKAERAVNGQAWTALNMVIDIDAWRSSTR